MSIEKVKVYEEQNSKAVPFWYWLLPLLLLLGLLAWYFTRDHGPQTAAITAQATATASAMPDLGTVHFDTDKATLTAEGQATLTKAAETMKDKPSIRLRLEGYTDSTGSSSHNDALSQARAATVEKFLEGKGIAKDRLTGEGFGEAKPVATNATEIGKADNRRVELFEK